MPTNTHKQPAPSLLDFLGSSHVEAYMCRNALLVAIQAAACIFLVSLVVYTLSSQCTPWDLL